MAAPNRQENSRSPPVSHPASRFPSLRRSQPIRSTQSASLPRSTSSNLRLLVDVDSVPTASNDLDGFRHLTPSQNNFKPNDAANQQAESPVSAAPSTETSRSDFVVDVSSPSGVPGSMNVSNLMANGRAVHPNPTKLPWTADTQAMQSDANRRYSDKATLAVAAAYSSVHLDHRHESWCTCDSEKESSYVDGRADQRLDVEARGGAAVPHQLTAGRTLASEIPPDFLVDWDGPTDIKNPKNWPMKQKWAATACIAAFTFISPLASSVVAPALGQIADEFHIINAYESQIVLSIFVLAYAIGPMVLGPLSEMYGRVPIAQVANVFFLIFNTACGFASSKEQLMVFRFLAGLGGSAPLAVGGGVLGDMFKPEERGKAMGMFAMGPLLGPALGPVVGGWIAQKSTWRWMFWAVSIMSLVILSAGLVWFRETYAPVLLHQKAKAIRKRTNDDRYRAESEGVINQPIWKRLWANLGRAFSMLFTQPIVQVMALYVGYSYGTMYLMLSTYTTLFVKHYHESIGISGLNYISIGLGFFIGAPLCGKTGDNMYKKLKARDPDNHGKPEFRMPIVIPFSCLVPVGLLLYGWSAQAKLHWIVPNIGALIFGIGTIAAFQCVTTYLVDTYARYAASAIAAVTILRSLMGFGFPLFAPSMYRALDYGWGNTILAGLALGVGVPVPILIWFFGEKLRKHSSLAMSAKLPPGSRLGPPGSAQRQMASVPHPNRVFEFKPPSNQYMEAAPSPVVPSGRPRWHNKT